MAVLAAILLSPGFFTLQPNEARVLILFGDYRGTAKQGGFCWGNPFYSNGPATQSTGQSIWTQTKNTSSDDSSQAQPKKVKRYKISLRARTLNGEKLKVNDKRGNPVDIAAVVVWRVEDTAKAVFDVDDFETYVATQSETAVRHLASAVSMVEMALHDFSENKVVEFDEERKAAMVSNLMVVLCGESQVTPVVNTGTLYT